MNILSEEGSASVEQVVQSASVVNCICCQLHCLHLHRWCLSPPRRSWSCTRRSQLGTQALWSQRPRGCGCRPLWWSPVVGSYKRNGPTRCSRRISFKCDMLGALNKVTTRWEGPQSLSYHKQSLGIEKRWASVSTLMFNQILTSNQSYGDLPPLCVGPL